MDKSDLEIIIKPILPMMGMSYETVKEPTALQYFLTQLVIIKGICSQDQENNKSIKNFKLRLIQNSRIVSSAVDYFFEYLEIPDIYLKISKLSLDAYLFSSRIPLVKGCISKLENLQSILFVRTDFFHNQEVYLPIIEGLSHCHQLKKITFDGDLSGKDTYYLFYQFIQDLFKTIEKNILQQAQVYLQRYERENEASEKKIALISVDALEEKLDSLLLKQFALCDAEIQEFLISDLKNKEENRDLLLHKMTYFCLKNRKFTIQCKNWMWEKKEKTLFEWGREGAANVVKKISQTIPVTGNFFPIDLKKEGADFLEKKIKSKLFPIIDEFLQKYQVSLEIRLNQEKEFETISSEVNAVFSSQLMRVSCRKPMKFSSAGLKLPSISLFYKGNKVGCIFAIRQFGEFSAFLQSKASIDMEKLHEASDEGCFSYFKIHLDPEPVGKELFDCLLVLITNINAASLELAFDLYLYAFLHQKKQDVYRDEEAYSILTALKAAFLKNIYLNQFNLIANNSMLAPLEQENKNSTSYFFKKTAVFFQKNMKYYVHHYPIFFKHINYFFLLMNVLLGKEIIQEPNELLQNQCNLDVIFYDIATQNCDFFLKKEKISIILDNVLLQSENNSVTKEAFALCIIQKLFSFHPQHFLFNFLQFIYQATQTVECFSLFECNSFSQFLHQNILSMGEEICQLEKIYIEFIYYHGTKATLRDYFDFLSHTALEESQKSMSFFSEHVLAMLLNFICSSELPQKVNQDGKNALYTALRLLFITHFPKLNRALIFMAEENYQAVYVNAPIEKEERNRIEKNFFADYRAIAIPDFTSISDHNSKNTPEASNFIVNVKKEIKELSFSLQ